MAEFKIDPDYKEVSERIDDLYAKHPEASLSGDWQVVEIGDKTYIAYRAICHRVPEDPAPSVGTAWEEFPGRTPYTKGSELQNAETSAWGRAIVAAGASRSKRIASADEMRSAQARQAPEPTAPARPAPASPERVERCKALVLERDLTEWVRRQDYAWPWSDEACHFIELYAQNQPGPNAATPEPETLPAAEEVAQTVAQEGWPEPTPNVMAAAIAAEVDKMSTPAVFAELERAGLSGAGTPHQIKDRLTAHRAMQAALTVDQSDEPF